MKLVLLGCLVLGSISADASRESAAKGSHGSVVIEEFRDPGKRDGYKWEPRPEAKRDVVGERVDDLQIVTQGILRAMKTIRYLAENSTIPLERTGVDIPLGLKLKLGLKLDDESISREDLITKLKDFPEVTTYNKEDAARLVFVIEAALDKKAWSAELVKKREELRTSYEKLGSILRSGNSEIDKAFEKQNLVVQGKKLSGSHYLAVWLQANVINPDKKKELTPSQFLEMERKFESVVNTVSPMLEKWYENNKDAKE